PCPGLGPGGRRIGSSPLPSGRANPSTVQHWPGLTLILKNSLVSGSIRPLATAGTGIGTAVDTERFAAVADGPAGRSSTQNGRGFDTPCLVTRRSGYIPTGVPGGNSTLTRNLAASLVLLASVG